MDLLRGIVMILMALDHTRDFFGTFGANPTDLRTASTALFFTRWITHFCAPTFFLLTGVGAGLSLGTRSKRELARYLVVRGALLIVLELTLVRALAYQFNVDYHVTMLLVLWALGWSMIVLAALLFLPQFLVGAVSLALIAGHNLLDGVRSSHPLWYVLHQPGFLIRTETHALFVSYPLLPWIGVTALGFLLARTFTLPGRERVRTLLTLGAGCIVAFASLRLANAYGDPGHWSAQPTAVRTLASFLNTNKYPPSLLFLLMTLGPALVLLGVTDKGVPAWLRPALAYGREPLAYYIAHFFLVHALATAVAFARYGAIHWMFESPALDRYPFTPPPQWGFTLPVVYAVWIVVVLAMYPFVRWLARYRAANRPRWLRYV